MRHVAIAEFKDHLSEFIAAVEAGEELILTRHGKAAVRITAADEAIESRRQRARAALSEMKKHRDRMRAEGRTATIEEMIAWKNEGRR